MEYKIIIPCAVVVLVVGFFIIKKLDAFLNDNRKRIEERGNSKENGIRIAFENPVIASSVSDVLEKFSKKYPDCELYFYTGTAEEIYNEMDKGNVDVGIFFSNSDDKYKSIPVPLRQSAVYSNTLGRRIEPLESNLHCIYTVKIQNETMKDKQNFLEELFNMLAGIKA